MRYLDLILEIADALFPLAMLLNGFSFGFVVADYLHTKSVGRHEKKKAEAILNNFPGHEGPGGKQEPKANQ